MRNSKPLLVLWAIGTIAIHVLGQDVNAGQTTRPVEIAANNPMLAAVLEDGTINSRETVGGNQSLAAVLNGQTIGKRQTLGNNQTLAVYFVGAITKPSPGQFNYYSVKSWETNATGWGRSAEFRTRILGRNYGGILFSDTPTNGTLYVVGKKPFSWPIRRYEFDVLWTHEFASVRHRVVPYVTSGAGAIALNGGPTESGWDRQAPLVAGAGSDVRLSRLLTARVGFTADWLKAPTYCDKTFRSTNTVMVEPRIGFVWGFGATQPR